MLQLDSNVEGQIRFGRATQTYGFAWVFLFSTDGTALMWPLAPSRKPSDADKDASGGVRCDVHTGEALEPNGYDSRLLLNAPI